MQSINIQGFRKKLLNWHRNKNHREMPWKGEKDPYKIWLSEIILQQTRVEQGLSYYQKFVENYPTIADLAQAPIDNVLKDWEGLGYYSRCRNMWSTAKYIHENLDGIFPNRYNAILSLKGVGQYTASAIASFAYNLPFAVVDGNVVRVISRYLATDRPFVSSADKKYYQEIANSFLSPRASAEYNQAIMDFGATLCKPQKPLCETCPFNNNCMAYVYNAVDQYPIKKKKVQLKKRYFHVVLLTANNHFYIRKRKAKDIWHGLYEPIIIEQKAKPSWLFKYKVINKTEQKLSHQHLVLHFYIIPQLGDIPIQLEEYEKLTKKELRKKAFPISVFAFLKENKYI